MSSRLASQANLTKPFRQILARCRNEYAPAARGSGIGQQALRELQLKLTTAGRRLRRNLMSARNEVLQACIAELPLRDQSELGKIASRMLETLTVSRDQADHICRLCDETVCRPSLCPVERKAVRLEAAR